MSVIVQQNALEDLYYPQLAFEHPHGPDCNEYCRLDEMVFGQSASEPIEHVTAFNMVMSRRSFKHDLDLSDHY